jgi:putative ABC transport system permease protein
MMARGRSYELRITGMFEDMPRNSHQRLSMVVRMDPHSYYADQPTFLTQWGANSGWTYVRLRPGTDPADINDNLQAWEKRNIPDIPFGGRMLNPGDFAEWRLVNLRDIHLGKAQLGGAKPGNDARTILTFAIIAFLILGMACVNFTNLATARASARAREVALRKVLGANRPQLMTQFLLESILVAGVAMLLALALVELLLPALGSFLDADLRMTYFGEEGMLLPVLLLTALVGAVGGVYPAFYLSRFQPAQVLKANKSTAEPAGSGALRNALVIGQFAISIGLIICTAVVYAQTVHARTADPGFKRDGLLQIEGISRRQLSDRLGRLTEELERVPGVTGVTRSTMGVGTKGQSNTVVQVPGRTEPVLIGNYSIDVEYFRTLGVPLLAGRELTTNQPLDRDTTLAHPDTGGAEGRSRRGASKSSSTSAVRATRLPNPADIVGKQFPMAAGRAGIWIGAGHRGRGGGQHPQSPRYVSRWSDVLHPSRQWSYGDADPLQ